jgi:sigma-B regulation protein RsbU (phosphoserine phosphatase)
VRFQQGRGGFGISHHQSGQSFERESAQLAGTRTATVAAGGHPPALMLHTDGTAGYKRTTGDPLLGIFPDARYRATTLTLHPGDTLLLYTDGLTEARTDSPNGRYGAAELLTFVTTLAPATPAEIIVALTGLVHSFGDGLDDDTAIMALSTTPRSTATMR